MTKHASQSPRDRVMWILSEHDGQMERSRLRAATGMRYALLDPIIEELARDGRIRIEEGLVAILEKGLRCHIGDSFIP
jgi:hypothetical protein